MEWFNWPYFLLWLALSVVVIILVRLAVHRRAKTILKAVDEITAEEVTGMRVEAAKQSLNRFIETEDFKNLLPHERAYLVIHKWPLSGPNGNFNIGSKAAAEMAECINKVL